jgi:hypothetical protein
MKLNNKRQLLAPVQSVSIVRSDDDRWGCTIHFLSGDKKFQEYASFGEAYSRLEYLCPNAIRDDARVMLITAALQALDLHRLFIWLESKEWEAAVKKENSKRRTTNGRGAKSKS